MPRGEHPNSRDNLKKGKPFSAETARKAAKKSQEVQAVTRDLMKAVGDRLDIDKASVRLAQLVEKGDINAWKLWLEYTASRPATKIEMDSKMSFTFGEDDETDPEE